jgi:RNase P protein component
MLRANALHDHDFVIVARGNIHDPNAQEKEVTQAQQSR